MKKNVINKINSDLKKKTVLDFSALLENSLDGMLIIDKDEKILYFNQAFKKMFGFSPKKMSNTSLEIFNQKEKNDNPFKNIVKKIKKEKNWEGEAILNTIKGEPFPAWIKGKIIKNKYSYQIILILRNITEWKKNETKIKKYLLEVDENLKTLQEEKIKSETIFTSIADGLFTVDNYWKITSFNPAAEKIMGIESHSAIGKSCHEIFHGELCRRECALSESKSTGKILLCKEGKIKDASGNWIPVIISTAPIKNLNGEIIGGVETFRDISEIEKINRELTRLNNIKTDFLSMVSHELKTPLTVIKGYIELMLHNRLGKFEPKQFSVLEMIKDRIDKLNLLINDLLDISQLEFGKFKINKMPFNLIELINSKKNEFMIIAQQKNLDLILDLICEEIIIHGDKNRISQVLSNILSNAIKFTNSGGKVLVQLECNTHYVQIHISDTGIGLTTEQIEKIFDKFYQVDTSNTRKYYGVGLGLAISKDIVEMHEGKISVKSNYGQGSTFTIALPYIERKFKIINASFNKD